jgi:CRP-like cAMP-binding protein
LKLLPSHALNLILPQLQRVHLRRHRVLELSNSLINHVYFIEHGLVSVLADTAPGKTIETRMIGPEGFIGIRVVLGKRESYHNRIVQVDGTALRIEADQLTGLLNQNKTLHLTMLGYVHEIFLQTSQLGACNAHHAVEERFARWLLMAQDRCGTAHIALTHKMLARALGVRRPTIGGCIAEFERRGVLYQSRSVINIADRNELEAIACNCYQVIKGLGKADPRCVPRDDLRQSTEYP